MHFQDRDHSVLGRPTVIQSDRASLVDVQGYLLGSTQSPETNHSVRLVQNCLGDALKVRANMGLLMGECRLATSMFRVT
jgi:hypothetical protein